MFISSRDELTARKNLLLNQINDLDNQLSRYAQPQDIQKIVSEEVKKQLSTLQSTDNVILRAMGEVLSHPDQVWLRDNLAGLPKFIASQDGKAIVEMLVDAYRKAVSK